MSAFELPKLPYALDALAPQISKETMEYHYGKHHKAYVDNLNKMVPGTKFEGKSLEEIIMSSDSGIFNNAAQVWNHTFFFFQLAPKPQEKPSGKLAEAIDRDFGSFEGFVEEFSKAGAGQFGSGWAWLVKGKDGKLSIVATGNAQNPMTQGLTPLMTVDVWEHAYYIDYRNVRADFIKAALAKTDWAVVGKRFEE